MAHRAPGPGNFALHTPKAQLNEPTTGQRDGRAASGSAARSCRHVTAPPPIGRLLLDSDISSSSRSPWRAVLSTSRSLGRGLAARGVPARARRARAVGVPASRELRLRRRRLLARRRARLVLGCWRARALTRCARAALCCCATHTPASGEPEPWSDDDGGGDGDGRNRPRIAGLIWGLGRYSGLSLPAHGLLAGSVDVTPAMAAMLIEVCRQRYNAGGREKVKWLVAPYGADAQLAFLAREKRVDAVIGGLGQPAAVRRAARALHAPPERQRAADRARRRVRPERRRVRDAARLRVPARPVRVGPRDVCRDVRARGLRVCEFGSS